MELNLRNFSFKLKEEFDRVELLHYAHGFFVSLAILIELFTGELGLLFLVKAPAVFVFYFLFNRTKLNLNYSFWSFSFLMGAYFIFRLFNTDAGSALFYSYFFALVILLVEMYILSSPIYYPRFNWWEYDFRYRDDLKIKVEWSELCTNGRLTDLRRGAGCVLLFEELEVGETLEIQPFDEWSFFTFQVEIMSKRRYYYGRPFNYGVRFNFKNQEEKRMFEQFSQFWKNERKSKLQKKFTSA